MNNKIKNKNEEKITIFKKFGPALLAIALGIGSGEFILWPFLTAHYGFGILWGALLGISIQVFLIIVIQKYTLIFQTDILKIFKKIWKSVRGWIIFSTILGFGWPAFVSVMSSLITQGLDVSENFFLIISIFLLVLAGGILIFSKNAYVRILFLQKINMTFLLVLIIFLFCYYFDLNTFQEMLIGFLGIGKDYLFLPIGISITTFLAGIAYAVSGGNLILANSFYTREENKKDKINFNLEYKNIIKQNFVFFLGGWIAHYNFIIIYFFCCFTK